MFEESTSSWRPFSSMASAKYPPSSTQKSRLNRCLRSSALASSFFAYSSSCQNSRASRAPRIFASYAYPWHSHVVRGYPGSEPSL